MTRALMSRADKMPYGKVAYADPGLQDDGVARYPLDSEEHIRAAWTYIHQRENADKYTPEQLRKVMARIRAAMEHIGAEMEDTARSRRSALTLPRHALPSPTGPFHAMPNRATAPSIVRSDPQTFDRVFALDDIHISRAHGADGRVVEAYAAAFDVAAEVRDVHGHYSELISRTAFDKTLRERGTRGVQVLYNHGFTAAGTPDMLGSVPLGTPLEIKADGRGLLTVTRYNKSALADSVLEAIRNGDIRGQSFRGRIYQSNPLRVPKRRLGEPLPTVTRTELGLSDYGPTATPVYEQAEILAVRSVQDLAAYFAELDEDQIAELVDDLDETVRITLTRNLSPTTDLLDEDDEEGEPEEDEEPTTPDRDAEGDEDEEPEVDDATPDLGAGTAEPPAERSSAAHSDRLENSREWMKREWNRRGDRRGKAA